MSWLDTLREKLNPAQRIIRSQEDVSRRTNTRPHTSATAYRQIEILNRCANMLIDSAAQCSYEVLAQQSIVSYGTIRQVTLDRILNIRPNPFMDISTFRRLIITDLLFEGVAYIFWDGNSLFHLPASMMEVVADKTKYINKFRFNNMLDFTPDQVIFIKDNEYSGSITSSITGQSRITSVLNSLNKRDKMLEFKEKFLDNGTVIGLILETDEILNKKMRERKQEELQLDYNPRTGQSTVLILDAGLKAKPYSQISSFKDLDFEQDLARFEKNVCTALGVPSVLIDGGNNANIRPNIELFYYMTVIPMLDKLQSSLQFFFGFEIEVSTAKVAALRPDSDAQAKKLTALVNNGIITGNEARKELNLEELDDKKMQEIRIPANVAGSATGVSGQEGGKPAGTTTEDNQ